MRSGVLRRPWPHSPRLQQLWRVAGLEVGLAVATALVAAAVFGLAPAGDSAHRPAGAAPPDGMAWVPGGEFFMGSDQPQFTDARPVHRVRVGGFWIDKTEVTNEQFVKF